MGWALGAILYEINEYPWEQLPTTTTNNNKDSLNSVAAHSWVYLLLTGVVGEFTLRMLFWLIMYLYILFLNALRSDALNKN